MKSKPVEKTYCAQCGTEVWAFSYAVVGGVEIIVCEKCRRAYVPQLTEEQIAVKAADDAATEKIKAQNARQGRHVGDDVYDRHYKGE